MSQVHSMATDRKWKLFSLGFRSKIGRIKSSFLLILSRKQSNRGQELARLHCQKEKMGQDTKQQDEALFSFQLRFSKVPAG